MYEQKESTFIELGIEDLLFFPITLPAKGLLFIFDKIAEAVDQERLDEDKVQGMLMELELRYELGEMSEEEYLGQEEELLKWLNAIKEYKKAQAQ